MARLEAVSKLLYYPTPEPVVDLLATWFGPAQDMRLVDPCCGTGAALRRFADGLQSPAETWGVEISYSRAEAAQKCLDVVLPASFYQVRSPSHWSNGSVSLAFNNPPYDWSEWEELRKGKKRRVRHEVLFLEGLTPKLVPGGHQVLIVPQSILGDPQMLGEEETERVARHLVGWYEDVQVYRFPGELFERFKQVVVLAIRKRRQYAHPGQAALEAITQLASAEIPELGEGDGQIRIPPAPTGVRFQYTPTLPADLLRAARRCSPIPTSDWKRATYVRPLGAAFTPAVPLSLGHITMLISGQETGVLCLPDEDGSPLLVKGMSRKVAQASGLDVANEKGEYSHTKVTEREKHVSTLSIARPDGALELLDRAKEVGDFITKYAEPVADAILKRNQPLYDWSPTSDRWERVGRSALGLPPLPNRKERGLFPAQKHFAIAASMVMQRHRHCILNAEMGFGKTSTSVAALELIDKWPALVMCPGHMVWKWMRDLERASDPDEPITARVITRPALSEPPGWVALRAKLESLGATIEETTRRQVDPTTPSDPGGRRKVTITFRRFARETPAVNDPDDAHAAEIYRLIGALAWRDAESKTVIQPQIQKLVGGLSFEYVDRDEYTLFDFVQDCRSGRLGRKPVAVIAFEPAKYDAGAGEAAVVKRWRRVYNEKEYREELVHVDTCPICGASLPPKTPWTCPECQSGLYNFNRWRRTGLARLVQKKFRHFFKVYVADEVHKAQNGRTDIGTADQRLLSAIRCSLALTGTLFGGSASSLFYLLYRRAPEIRRLYAFNEQTRWVDHYGLWERSWDQKEPLVGERGAATGIQRWNFRQRELPGIGPGVIRFLLPITLFGNITDLGYTLPALYEDVQSMEMTDEQGEQYGMANRTLLQRAIELSRHGDAGALSVWFNTVRFRPASCFRNELVSYSGKKGGNIHLELPAVIHPQEWLPKERTLAELVRKNMHLDRKTLCFVEQTGTRDIRTRLKQAIEALAPGGNMTLVEVGVLSAGDMAPARREAWIRKSAPWMDAMLVNPKLVETGLDLVMFSDLVFYEVTTSLYVLWQSMRRVWRLGQEKDVNVRFLAYKDTMEEEILRRMGQKMKYAQLLYGKEAAGVLVESDSADDLQREIINAALEGKAFKSAGEAITGIFTTGTETSMRVTHSPAGSALAASPTITISQLPEGEVVQLTMFGLAPVLAMQLPRRKRR